MGSWSEHGQNSGGYYKCNKFVGGEGTAASAASASAKSEASAKFELEKYLHYYTRYHGHEASMVHAKQKTIRSIDNKMKEIQDAGNGAWIDIQYLRQAVLQVIECRLVLKYTYVLGYFMPAGPQKQLFEYQQEMLEKNTDQLSEFTENPNIESIDRTNVVNLTRITGIFLHDLMEFMMNNDDGLGSSPSTGGVSAASGADGETKSSGVAEAKGIPKQAPATKRTRVV
jgi:ariadne-1